MSDSHYIHITRHADQPAWRLGAVSRFLAGRVATPASVLAEQAAQAVRVFTQSWDKFLFRRFWGQGASSGDVDLVIDSYENVLLRNRFRWTDSVLETETHFPGEVIP